MKTDDQRIDAQYAVFIIYKIQLPNTLFSRYSQLVLRCAETNAHETGHSSAVEMHLDTTETTPDVNEETMIANTQLDEPIHGR
jgi:hypothetical protein